MSETTIASLAETEYPKELREILRRAHAGDASVLPALNRAYDEYPDLAQRLGDLVQIAEQSLLTLAAGPSLAAQAAIRRQVDGLRAGLAKDAVTPLERLLVDRICIAWLGVYQTDVAAAHYLRQNPEPAPACQASQRRLDRAQARFLAAVKALAVLKKLTRQAPSPLELAQRPVGETPGMPITFRRNQRSEVA